MTKKFFIFKKKFDIIFFRTFKPINPIDFDGKKIFKPNIFKKILYTLKDTTFKKIFNGWLFLRALILIKEILVSLISIFYLPIILILYFTKYRFLHINSWQVGAYIQSLDTIIKSNLIKEKKYKIFFLYPGFLKNNKFFDTFYSDHIVIKENFFLYLFLYPLINSRLVGLTNWKYETINPNSDFNRIHRDFNSKYRKYILANDETINVSRIFDKICFNYNFEKNKKIISIHQKDNEYYSGSISRSSDINKLNKTIKYLLNKNFYVVRFISHISENLNFNSDFYKEIKIDTDNEKLIQYVILSRSCLVICHQGGIHSYNQIIDVPFLQINSSPININPLIKDKDRTIFKKFYSDKLNRFLTIREIIDHNLHLHIDMRTLKSKQIKIIENDEDEILDATKSILENSNNDFYEKFKSKIPNQISFKNSNAKICSSFLEKNKYLFN